MNPRLLSTGPNRTLELLRRVCLLVGTLLSIYTLVQPADALFRVRTVDFAKLQKKDTGWNRSTPTLTLEQYIAKKTADRLVEVTGREWAEFATSSEATLAGKSTELARHLNVGFSSPDSLYFPTTTAPLRELVGRLNDGHVLTYVAVNDTGTIRYLEVLWQRPPDALREAPNWMLFPYRRHAIWAFIAGLLLYVLLPWYRKGTDELRYSTARAMVVPDFLGLALTVFFGTLPVLIILSNSSSSGPPSLFGFSNGWWPITLAMWLMACGGLAVLVMSYWYATFSLWISSDGFRLRTCFRDDTYAFADMVGMEPYRQEWPLWLKVVAFYMVLARPRMAGPLILGATQETNGIAIRMKDGRILKLALDYLEEMERVFRALRQANVPLDPELAQIIDEALANPEPVTPPGKGGKIAARILVVLAVVGALTWHYWPETTRVVRHEPQYSQAQLTERLELNRQMRAIETQMKQALALPANATPEERAAGMRKFEELKQQLDALERQYDAIQPTAED